MTREEAKRRLLNIERSLPNTFCTKEEVRNFEALEMAIKALEQEPSVEFVKTEESNNNGTKYLNINVSDDEVKRNPDIVRLCSDVGMLEYAKPSGDAISRQAVQDYIAKYLSQYLYNDVREAVEVIDEYIGELPSVKQEQKTGHWCRKTKVDAYDIAGVKTWGIKCQCDRCDFTTIVVEDFGYYKYCPNCGAKMVEPQERREEE